MKKIILFLFIATSVTTTITAQTKDVKVEQKVLKNTIKDKKEDRKEIGKDAAHLRLKSAWKGHKEVRQHRKSANAQKRILKAKGVKHPKMKAKEQIEAEGK